MTTHTPARELAIAIARIVDHEQGDDVLVLEVGPVSSIAEYFVLANGSNRRLVRRLVEGIEEGVSDRYDERPIRVEGAGEQEWVLVDYGNVVAHVFLDEIRAFYEIERLYNDVAVIDWAEAATTAESGAGDRSEQA